MPNVVILTCSTLGPLFARKAYCRNVVWWLVTTGAEASSASALVKIIRQSELAGVTRRVAVLHGNKLVQAFAKPHYVRLARQALQNLAQAERTQVFDLSHERFVVVWRGGHDAELRQARASLTHLLSGQEKERLPLVTDLLTLHDLPSDASQLLDVLADDQCTEPCSLGKLPLDVEILERLETDLAQCDLSHFVRMRPVMTLSCRIEFGSDIGQSNQPAWHERYVDTRELASSLCPTHDLCSGSWLVGRLTRTLDARVFAMLMASGELRRCTTLAINVNVATLLRRDFLCFDNALPRALRGEVILIVRADDMLADPAAYIFARSFVLSRGYRLALANTTSEVLRFIDLAAAGVHFIQVALSSELKSDPKLFQSLLPPEVSAVLTGLDLPSDLRWAIDNGFKLGRGQVFSR